jgi:hypothetical protein
MEKRTEFFVEVHLLLKNLIKNILARFFFLGLYSERASTQINRSAILRMEQL